MRVAKAHRLFVGLFAAMAVLGMAAVSAQAQEKKIKIGVVRNPPPTPSMPVGRPTMPPRPMIIRALTDTPATGR